MISTHAPRAHRANKRHGMALFTLLAVTAASLLAAAPANAQGRYGQRSNGPGYYEDDFREPRGGHGHGHDHVCTDQCGLRCVKFQRGFAAGRQAGYGAGFRDGRWRRPFCAEATACLMGRGRAYVKGFNAGFTEAYEDGYQRGKRRYRQRNRRPIRRVWWRW